MTVRQVSTCLQLTSPEETTPGLREQIADCWEAVANAGGAVLATEFPPLPVSAHDVAPVVDSLVHELHPARGRLLVAVVGDSLAGWLIVRREPHPLGAHCGTVNHVQTHPRFRGRCIGVAPMHRVHGIARDEMGPERLSLSTRGGASLAEDWDSWWSGAAGDPELAPFLTRGDDGARPRCEGNDLTLSGHVALLREAGFEHVGAVWQVGPSHVLAAVR
ncbi:hypothetical protein [Streptomyces stelliscabiei]|uniref:GNAT superfamily N-acetyltransferase n=1 Tax=Streptomyces stelliscabiei TaxID=146820 RepID=A0A8I0P1V4_9ACTN|nr:hypothetical protein [Streptomyces stelliscabiei]MBE1594734.1 GNAT superfamily N-acetyltransferase [Streptomyces stelliscabiei]MDX2519015.1 GNAT family N-acetyltransferase [Streptomyces stelliscabiei]MDX2550870.1 GNAT family N-acetyltransferase [Streptomyces stelliscabiei]MDX2616648.1 GNAT family N-acetyltransferase [Streptomyces stelliscabiei]MDX2635743.1 GNAT family N-acetyltransferase [Streptomyces stelliscabiei]